MIKPNLVGTAPENNMNSEILVGDAYPKMSP